MSLFRAFQAARGGCHLGRYIQSHASSKLRLGKYSCRTMRTISQHANSRKIPTSVDEFPLTREEAFAFVSDTLRIPNCHQLLKQDRLSLLNTLLHRLKHTVPVSNVTALAQDNSEYGENEILFLEKCKNDVLACRGGQCYWISGFFNVLLRHLQFETTLCAAGAKLSSQLKAHAAIIVHNLEGQGSRHLVESSPSHPIFEAVPLDFDEQSGSFVRLGERWKYFNAGEGTIKYCRLMGGRNDLTFPSSEIIDSEGEQWEVKKKYETSHYIPLSQFTELSLLIVTGAMGNLAHLYLGKHLVVHGFSGVIGNWVTVRDKIVIKDEDGIVLESMAIPSDCYLIDRVTEYFPQYPANLIELCLKNMKRYKP